MTPIIRLTIMMRQAWVSETPICIMAGTRMGPRISMAAVPSMKQPTNSRKRLMTIRNTNFDWMPVKNVMIVWGIWAMVRM